MSKTGPEQDGSRNREAERPAWPPVWPFAALAAGLAFILSGGQALGLRAALALGAAALVAAPGLLSRRILRQRMERMSRARQQSRLACSEKSGLLATITHELRTPMNGVIGMAGLLRETRLTEEQEAYVKAIESSGRSLLSIIDEILQSARQEAEEAAPAPVAFDPCALVEEVCELLAPRAHARGLDLACFVDPALEGRRMGAAGRIRQVLVNLVGNAVKFTEHGGVHVRALPAAGGHLRIEVHDSGIGLSREQIGQIFEPFRQAPSGHEGEGAGLGLYISRRLVEAMGGRLEVRSRPGAGSVFSFQVPAPPAQGEERAAPAASLHGAQVLLAIPPGVRRRALRDYVLAYGGRARTLGREELEALLAQGAAEEGDIICDAAHADILRRALAGGRGGLPRLWLLLTPEERRGLADLLESDLAGFLLSPLRRRTFVVQFVERQPHARAVAAARALRAMLPGRAEGSRPLVLLAEDNDINALLARRILEAAGMAVMRARDGHELLEMLLGDDPRAAHPALILMDVQMPGMDGLEATQRIRLMERRGGRPAIPIFALTANPTEEEKARCLAAGMDGFLAKPFDREDLLQIVGGALGQGAPLPRRA